MQWKSKGFKNVMDAVQCNTGLAEEFLHPSQELYYIQNLDLMAMWIKVYASQNAPVTVIGDYDADGVCATAGLYLLLRELHADNIKLRLPRRMSEGYGLSEKIVEEIDGGVIITVDNGISAIPAIKKAKEKGMVVLVIDHHEPKMDNGQIVLPEADLIVDPHVPDHLIQKGVAVKSTFDGYCGAGLVYKLAQAMIPGTKTLKKISAFAAIATVADVMPLVSDNRNIYHEGIRSIRDRDITPGLQCMVNLLQSDNIVNEGDIGFKLAPMLNAPGRLYDDGANISLQTLITGNYTNATMMAQELNGINDVRKGKKEEAVKRAVDMIEKENLIGANPLIICDPKTAEGVVGLVAGFLSEEYNCSAIVFTKTEHGLKGSARAADYNNIKESLDKFHDLHPEILSKYGGHKGAAGLSIPEEGFLEFRKGMNEIMGAPHPKPDTIEYDIEITASEVSNVTAEIHRFAPFGEGNPPVVVKIRDFKTVPIGNSFYTELRKGAIKFSGPGCSAIAFNMAERFKAKGCPTCMDLIGTLGYQNYMGKPKVQIEVSDFVPSVSENKKPEQVNQSIASILCQYHLAT